MGDEVSAARFVGAADVARTIGKPPWRPQVHAALARQLRAALGEDDFERELTRGRAWGVTTALEAAVACVSRHDAALSSTLEP